MKLIPGSGGVFEITVNHHKIYSKKEAGQFPDFKQIIGRIEEFNFL